ncbi:MAG: hypothetical protein U9O65_10620 [Thermotogota bacterium]|nr:hypothetical protein [Thermotogota bacterium]
MIFLNKNQKHELKQKQEAEQNKYRNLMVSLSDELVEWLKEKDLTIGDFENLVGFVRSSFEMSFKKTKIKSFNKK